MKLILIIFIIISINLYSNEKNINKIEELISSGKYLEAEELVQDLSIENDNFKLQVLAGDIFYELENYEKALRHYERAFDIDDDKEEIFIKYGRVLSLTGNTKKSTKILKEGIDDYKKSIPLHIEMAQVYLREGNLKDAEVEIGRAKKIDENSPLVYIAFGDMYFDQKVYELSKNNYQKALQFDEENLEAREKLAISLYWLANQALDKDLKNALFTESLKEWDLITQKDTMNASAFFNKGKILYLAQRYDKAAPALNRYATLRPRGYLGKWYLAQSLYELNLCDDAAPFLDEVANNIDSVQNKAKLFLARCYYDNKNYNGAVEEFNRLSSEGELEAKDLQKYGTALLFSGDTTNALSIYKDLMKKDPISSCKLSYMVGRLMITAKNYEEALFFLRHRLETTECSDDEDSKVNYYIGLSYLFNESADSSIIYLERAIQLDSLDISAYIYLGDALLNNENEKEAINYYMKAIDMSKSDLENKSNQSQLKLSYGKLSGFYYEKKDWSNLIKLTTDWSKIQSEESLPCIYAAVAYQSIGDSENACKWYKKVLKLDPQNKIAKQNIEALGC